MTYEQYKKVFASIDAGLWELANAAHQPIAQRIQSLERDGDRTKAILAEYVDRSVERMQALLTAKSFSKLPMPRRRIPIWTRLSIRRELFRSMKSAPFGRILDCESWKERDGQQASNPGS